MHSIPPSSFLLPHHLMNPVVAAGRAGRLQGVKGVEPLLQACPVVVGPAESPAPDQQAVIVVRTGKLFVYIHCTLALFNHQVHEVRNLTVHLLPVIILIVFGSLIIGHVAAHALIQIGEKTDSTVAIHRARLDPLRLRRRRGVAVHRHSAFSRRNRPRGCLMGGMGMTRSDQGAADELDRRGVGTVMERRIGVRKRRSTAGS